MSRTFIDFIGEEEGVEWTGVPTKGGGEMVPFLLGGKVDFAFSGGIHNRFGDQMKVLASMNSGRLLASPDIPSIMEEYGIAMPSQAVIVVPKDTSDDVIAILEMAMKEASMEEDFVDLVSNKLKFPVNFVGSQELTLGIQSSLEGLKRVLQATH